jgi:hypothetical protein
VLRIAADAHPADWVVAGVRGFAESVLSLVPEGFGFYVRLFHPAYRRPAEREPPTVPVRWQEIAAANGARAHPAMQLVALTRSEDSCFQSQPGVYDQAPSIGSLPVELIAAIVPVLGRHTSTPNTCWFCVCDGWGAIRPDVATAPAFRLPHRRHHLLGGPIACAAENLAVPTVEQSPNLWWPDDHAWCVATEIDLNTTYIGCDQECRDDLLALVDVEAVAIDPASGVSRESDSVNRAPERPRASRRSSS